MSPKRFSHTSSTTGQEPSAIAVQDLASTSAGIPKLKMKGFAVFPEERFFSFVTASSKSFLDTTAQDMM